MVKTTILFGYLIWPTRSINYIDYACMYLFVSIAKHNTQRIENAFMLFFAEMCHSYLEIQVIYKFNVELSKIEHTPHSFPFPQACTVDSNDYGAQSSIADDLNLYLLIFRPFCNPHVVDSIPSKGK